MRERIKKRFLGRLEMTSRTFGMTERALEMTSRAFGMTDRKHEMTDNNDEKITHKIKNFSEDKMKKIVLVALLAITAMVCGAFGLRINSASALTSSTLNSAVKAGNGAELWDTSKGDFNDSVKKDLFDKLFGGENEVEYIKKNGAEDYGTYHQGDTPYYVVPASVINAKVGNANYGLTVKLGGMDWMAASLTLADVGTSKDNVVLTLYLANDYITGSQYTSSGNNIKGVNMYSSSTLRYNLLSWEDFKLFSEGSFASEYLVQPKYINYQQTETIYGRQSNWYNCPNDALGALSSGWYSGINYQPDDTVNDIRYDAWGNDYIWVPSITEAGTNSVANTTCIWKLSNDQRAHNVQTYPWLRSGDYNDYYDAYILKPSGDLYYGTGTYTLGVRPAIHLNLTAGHEHAWGEWSVTKSATCTTAGEKVRTCSYFSGHKETESIAALGHDYSEEYTIDTAATCTTTGSKSRHCTRCTEKIEVTVIPKLGHDWGEWTTVTAATCTTGGKQKHTCSRDGCTETEEQNIPATGHKYEDKVTPPTCTDEGYTTHTCTVCGDEYEDTAVEAAGHRYGTPSWKWGTNYLTATAKFTCSVCHSEHTLNAKVTHESKTASCTAAGDVTHTATVSLNDTPYTEAKVTKGEKLPHDSELVSTEVEPTCIENGSGQFRCKTCGEEYTEIIPAAGHSYGTPEWEWGADYHTARADFRCGVCEEHKYPEAEVTYEDGEENRTYTATVTFEGETYTDVKRVPDNPDNPDKPDKPDGTGCNGGLDWVFIAIMGGIGLLALALIILLGIVRKSRKEESGEEYDYEDEEDDDEDEDY